jgi:ADP-L-glycero-D-manno-heptose 6-epimerase
MIIVTGAAGFIGSALVWALNRQGEKNLLLVDDVDHPEKEHNIGHLQYERLVGIKDFRQQLLAGPANASPLLGSGASSEEIEAIFHLGACSDTTEDDWDYLLDNNVEYTKDIIRWCADTGVRCIYASSAATYGDGQQGFRDDHALFDQLEPLNLYGKSKLMVDIWARDGGYLDRAVGLRYFNVYGPNEQHKEHMQSVIAKKFPQVHEKGYIELFKSEHQDFQDGEQDRDFLYVKDAVAMTLFFLEKPNLGGVYNIGTGKAQTWNDVAAAMFSALNKKPDIRYVGLPANLKDQYQYHTQADMRKLKAAGWKKKGTSLTDAISDYVQSYLLPHKHLGEK